MSKKISPTDFIDQLKCRSEDVKQSLLDYFSHHKASNLHPWHLAQHWFFGEKKPPCHQPFSGEHLFSDSVLALLKQNNPAINDDIIFIKKQLIDRRLCQWGPYHLPHGNIPETRTELWLKRENAQSKHARWKATAEIILGMRYLPSMREASHWGNATALALWVIPAALFLNGCLVGLQQAIPSFTSSALVTTEIALSVTAAVLFITLTLVFYGIRRTCDNRDAKTFLDKIIYRSDVKTASTNSASHSTDN